MYNEIKIGQSIREEWVSMMERISCEILNESMRVRERDRHEEDVIRNNKPVK